MEEMKLFLTRTDRQEFKIGYLQGKYPKLSAEIIDQQVKKFVAHWSEKNKAGTKQKWELEKTFELDLRLGKWFDNYLSWQKAPVTAARVETFSQRPKEVSGGPVVMEFTTDKNWDEVLAELKSKIPENDFKTWLLPLFCYVEPDNGVLKIEVPNKTYTDWINKHYRRMIEK